MDEVPGVLPPLVFLAEIDVLDGLARVLKLPEVVHLAGAVLLGEDAPSAEDAVGVGCEVNGSADFAGQSGLFVDLRACQMHGPRFRRLSTYSDFMALATEADGDTQTSNASTDNGNLQRVRIVVHQRVLGPAGGGVVVSVEGSHCVEHSFVYGDTR